jgi:hypothetical protein
MIVTIMVTVAGLTTERRRTGGREKGREWREGGETTIERSSPDSTVGLIPRH